MVELTINDVATISGNGEGTLLAGRYRVVRQLGSGGMGSVWLAEDTQLDNKPFAIKMLPAILVANKRAYRQLKDEALVAMKLTHPNIVTLRAFEENNGNPFLVMDYVDGQTLDDYLAEHGGGNLTQSRREAESQRDLKDGFGYGIPEEDVVRILKPIAAALDYAHGEGVVHRDVKPANVMIRKDGHPFILDFGIAREIQETMTRVTGKLSSGTLLYMSPEQLRGQPPKAVQDIYSFAAMVYECLKGEPPFSRGQIEFQILNEPPEPLVGRGSLISGVMSGLAKKPEDRPSSCMAVLEGKSFSRVEHVERVEVGTDSIKPPPVGSRVPRDRPAERSTSATEGMVVPVNTPHQGGALKALAVAAGITFVVVGGWWYANQKHEDARMAEQRSEEARRKARVDAEGLQRKEAERRAEAERKKEAERLAKEKAEAERRAAEERVRLAVEAAARAAATEIRIEAKVQKANVERISDADGFKEKKDALVGSFARADALFDEKTRRWSESAVLFTNYVNECKALAVLDGERQTAVAKRTGAQTAFRRAEDAGAKTYAKDSWNAAVKTWNMAASEFGNMEFVAAAETFTKAIQEFDACMTEAWGKKRAEEEKLAEEKRMAEAREAEQRRREEAARQAEEFRRAEAKRVLAAAERERQRAAADNGHEKVQLWAGGPYWATTNIGANRPEEYGLYFWWGDTIGYKREGDAWVASDGSSSNFRFLEGNAPTYRKSTNTLQSEGWITAYGVLVPEHDAARMHWGGAWRMPTGEELEDLCSKCDWTWTTMNDVRGYIISGRGDYAANSIFLPCAGLGGGLGSGTLLRYAGSNGLYWSSVPSSDKDNSACRLGFNSGYHSSTLDNYRYRGQSVRAVQGFTK